MGSGVRSSQNCARCGNHGIVVPLKGHKNECLFRSCECFKCLETVERQKCIAEEISNHRREDRTVNFAENPVIISYQPIYEEISDDNSTPSISSSPSTLVETRREQQCSRCRNHGFLQMLKGHKSLCPFRTCSCKKCEVTSRRREVMAKHVKDTRDREPKSPPSSTVTSSMLYGNLVDNSTPPSALDASNFCIQQFVDYEPAPTVSPLSEPEFDADLFFMIQSLFEKYTCQGNNEKVQLIRAFTELANFDWQNIESALAKGECVE